MGTNFYWTKEGQPPCECCGRSYDDETIHIGKSSAGWMFSLHVTDEIQSLVDWQARFYWPDSYIEDEYGKRLTPIEMITRITMRDPDSQRHEIEYNGRVRHGLGTYDLIRGEFS